MSKVCFQGNIKNEKSYKKALEKAKNYQDIFGKDNFFIEIHNHGISQQVEILDDLSEQINGLKNRKNGIERQMKFYLENQIKINKNIFGERKIWQNIRKIFTSCNRWETSLIISIYSWGNKTGCQSLNNLPIIKPINITNSIDSLKRRVFIIYKLKEYLTSSIQLNSEQDLF